jgi:hypothetical protein
MNNEGAGGGGGRIAVMLTNSATFGSVSMNAVGGLKNAGVSGGAAGTIYLKGTDSAYGKLIVSNNVSLANTANIKTLISTQVTDAVVGDVQLLNTAQFAVSNTCTLTVYGSWSNAVATNAFSGGTVVFAGTNSATVWGGNTWSNLTIATSGKIVSFQTNTIQYIFGVPAYSNVTLQSTVSGTWWYLHKTGIGTQDVGIVTVRDSNATNGWTFRASAGSSDLGNNVNWLFSGGGGDVVIIPWFMFGPNILFQENQVSGDGEEAQ